MIELLFLAYFVVPPFLFGGYVFYPYTKPFRKSFSKQFATLDMPAMLAMLAYPMLLLSVIREWRPQIPYENLLVIGAVLIGVFLFAWRRGVSMLTSYGITDVRRRFVFLAVVLPITLMASAVVVPLVSLRVITPVEAIFWRHESEPIVPWIIACISLVALAFVLKRLSIWILANALPSTAAKLSKAQPPSQ